MTGLSFDPIQDGVWIRIDAGGGRGAGVDLTRKQFIEAAVMGAYVAGLPQRWKG
jgi:hypothetical protein